VSGYVKPANDSGTLTGRASHELLPFGDDTSDTEEKKAKNKANRELHNMISDQDLAHDGLRISQKTDPIPRRFIRSKRWPDHALPPGVLWNREFLANDWPWRMTD
jgi:hypothetical protein